MTEQTCSRCHDRPAATGIEWCRGCRRRIDQDLGDLPALADDLADTMARLTAAKTGQRPGGEKPLPYSERAAEALHALRGFLVSWCRLLADEQGANLPADTIGAMTGYLQRWLPWLAKHPAAGELADELRDVYATATVAVDLPNHRRVFVGPCPTRTEQGQCPGELWAFFPLDEGKRPTCKCQAPRGLNDLVCGLEWLPESWASLGRTIGRPGSGWVTPAEAAAMVGRSVKTVYNAAITLQWRRMSTEVGVLYRLEDVTAWRADETAC